MATFNSKLLVYQRVFPKHLQQHCGFRRVFFLIIRHPSFGERYEQTYKYIKPIDFFITPDFVRRISHQTRFFLRHKHGDIIKK